MAGALRFMYVRSPGAVSAEVGTHRMPELPDITVYVEALERRIVGETLVAVRIKSPFLLRTFDPPADATHGKTVREVRRLGKRIGLGLDDDLWLVLHLMIAGRLHWKPPGVKLLARGYLAALDFPAGSVLLTEAGSKHRASLSVLRGRDAWKEHDPGGLEVPSATLAEFRSALAAREPHDQARPHRPSRLQRDRQRLLGRDPPPRPPLAAPSDPQALARAGRKPLHRHARDPRRVDRPPPRRGGRRLSRGRDGLPPRDGRPRSLRQALSGLLRPRPAHPLRRPRDELLPPLPDRRQDPRGPIALPTAEGRLASSPG